MCCIHDPLDAELNKHFPAEKLTSFSQVCTQTGWNRTRYVTRHIVQRGMQMFKKSNNSQTIKYK